MRYSPINNTLFKANRRRFAELLPAESIAIFHSNEQFPRNGDQYFPFRQQSDLFYLSGIEQEKTILIIAPGAPNPQLREVLFILKSNEVLAQWEGHKYSPEEATAISGIEQIRFVDDYEAILRDLLFWTKNIYLNFNEYPKFFSEVVDRNERMGTALKAKYPLYNYHRSAPLLTQLRMVKSDAEIELIKLACDITGKAFRRVLKTIKPGMNEMDVQAEFEHEFTINRANGHGYQPIVASGKNACVLHYIDNNAVCQEGDLVLFDVGAEYANYSADMSRTIPVNGRFTERQRSCYEAVLRVQREIIKLYTPGNSITQINKRTEELMEHEMINLGLFTRTEMMAQDAKAPLFKKYFMHGTAHFLGLDVHDVGPKESILQPGMVLTCEPGIYIPEENIGIRLENDILVTDGEPVDLMAEIPIDPDEIEQLMG
ncbi:MAG: aminopeptidase P family protein [Bacteroidales bacterium]|jgi:Xaa-Pro aminopeptidase